MVRRLDGEGAKPDGGAATRAIRVPALAVEVHTAVEQTRSKAIGEIVRT
jgi:hypothetical protein